MPIADSELITNEDGSIYHLNLKPEHIAKTVILVGDPDRVERVSKHFDAITFKTQKREFHTHTGRFENKEITVISTGIGTDNIDIVLNELDALVNIDLTTKEIKDSLTSLDLIRIGTSGAIQEYIPVDSFLISEFGIGFDNVLHFYQSEQVQNQLVSKALSQHLAWSKNKSIPYAISYNEELGNQLHSERTLKGITITNVGFYGPQGRVVRLPLSDNQMNTKIASFAFENKKITNLEMETSAIYGLSKLLGHRAVSMNAILANRATGDFSKSPQATIDALIRYTLHKIVGLDA